jgi:hypothetical protein
MHALPPEIFSALCSQNDAEYWARQARETQANHAIRKLYQARARSAAYAARVLMGVCS